VEPGAVATVAPGSGPNRTLLYVGGGLAAAALIAFLLKD
jgi:hypothetical protein